MRAFLFALPLVLAVAGCSARKAPAGFADDGGLGSSSGGSSGGSSGSLLGDASAINNGVGCSDAAKLVYVVSDQNDLYSFHPDTLTFTKIGTMNCPAAASTQPNSMAVDRSGVAWVNYNDGTLFKVSTANASCQATPFQPGQHSYGRFGMAFSSNAAGSTDETLFVAGIVTNGGPGPPQGQGVAKIDLSTFVLTPIGDFSGILAGAAAEFTGTGEGKLYGFFTTQPAHLALVDKSTGATSAVIALSGVSTGTDWAFSFWGGDFWFYTADTTNNGPSDTTDVTRLKAATDSSLGVVKSQIGFRIVGAGVSTCAPITPPK